eukprot:2558098-Rhodomonas_salina.2
MESEPRGVTACGGCIHSISPRTSPRTLCLGLTARGRQQKTEQKWSLDVRATDAEVDEQRTEQGRQGSGRERRSEAGRRGRGKQLRLRAPLYSRESSEERCGAGPSRSSSTSGACASCGASSEESNEEPGTQPPRSSSSEDTPGLTFDAVIEDGGSKAQELATGGARGVDACKHECAGLTESCSARSRHVEANRNLLAAEIRLTAGERVRAGLARREPILLLLRVDMPPRRALCSHPKVRHMSACGERKICSTTVFSKRYAWESNSQ